MISYIANLCKQHFIFPHLETNTDPLSLCLGQLNRFFGHIVLVQAKTRLKCCDRPRISQEVSTWMVLYLSNLCKQHFIFPHLETSADPLSLCWGQLLRFYGHFVLVQAKTSLKCCDRPYIINGFTSSKLMHTTFYFPSSWN